MSRAGSHTDSTNARRTALAVVLAVALFSAAFLGLVAFLDRIAPASSADYSVTVGESELSEPFYTLLIGSDSRKGTALYTGKATDHAQVDQHADIMTLVRVDPTTYTITLLTIPRDTVLEGTTSKLNDTFLDGDPVAVVEAVEGLTGVDVGYYMLTTFSTFSELVDAMGGVVVDVPRKVTAPDPATGRDVTVNKGSKQELDGSEALVLARARKEYGDDQDALRQVNVRNLETALIAQALGYDQERLNGIVIDLEEYTDTNIDVMLMAQLAYDFAAHKDEVVVYSGTGPYKGGVGESGAWVIGEDSDAWSELMAVVDAGGDPAEVIKPPAFSK